MAAPTAIIILTAAGAVQTHREPLIAAALCILAVLTSAVLIWIDATGWPLVVGLAVLATGVALACWGDPRNLGWFGMCVIAGWAALVLTTRWAIAVDAALTAAFIVMLSVVSPEPGWITWTFGVALTCGAFVFVRRERELVERLHAAQAELAERARTDERHRIAREMHDLVGHSLTVSLLHLGSARLALDDDLDAARTALTEAENAARDSLEDVRAAVGLMRSGDAAAASPTPAVADIPDLIHSYRNAGADIDLDLRGVPAGIAASRSLTAYRIVQESLTNAVRHGDGGPIKVRLDTTRERIKITVRNGGAPPGRRPAGTGITAMNERVATLGGTLSAGPSAGGWLVEAVIPA
ncbi:histidine kinase [Gordonia sp. ABSL11-1]|uniref:sensor histidine kinase n=1 Tax=Gordonia sp. ABSL11-1 TaxID=3053924 RepID=UPI00257308CB|nr:histidine kinase [Gordonia sp. ABSL11-1]MDL9947661.1 histidine kinase [Gordonia sp. ABSL11-1]